MKKSVSTRIKITGTGKLLRRKMKQGHFLAKKTGKEIRGKRLMLSAPQEVRNAIRGAFRK